MSKLMVKIHPLPSKMKYKGKKALENMINDLQEFLEKNTKTDYYYLSRKDKGNVCLFEIIYYPRGV